jgi:chromosome segregation ATPase
VTIHYEQLNSLKNKLLNCQKILKELAEATKNLESKNRQTIQQKEIELEEWRQKLEVYQQEEIKIKKEIKQKVQALEQSQLSNSEKQVQINRLLTEHSGELEELDKLFEEERSHYRQIRDKLIGKLCEPCQTCSVKTQILHQKGEKITYLLVII